MAEDEMVSVTDAVGLWEIVEDREAWYVVVHGVQRVRHKLATEQQHFTLIYYIPYDT